MHKVYIQTDRLLLRQWETEDLELLAALNIDPRVMEFFNTPRSWEETKTFVEVRTESIDRRGWGCWAVSLVDTDEFIGFIGIDEVPMDLPFAPAVEIGWRLAYKHWGKGYATEGAKACLQFGFEKLGLKEIVAFTTVNNMRSRRVMEKIGMHCNRSDDFDHPKVPAGHPLCRHVLYRIANQSGVN
ncbi:MAG: GNAT family N-acetyltransferase [Chlamydiota bacterium]